VILPLTVSEKSPLWKKGGWTDEREAVEALGRSGAVSVDADEPEVCRCWVVGEAGAALPRSGKQGRAGVVHGNTGERRSTASRRRVAHADVDAAGKYAGFNDQHSPKVGSGRGGDLPSEHPALLRAAGIGRRASGGPKHRRPARPQAQRD